MSKNNRFALIAALMGFGQVFIFLILSIITGNWGYLMWSCFAAVSVGVPTLIHTLQHIKKDKHQTK